MSCVIYKKYMSKIGRQTILVPQGVSVEVGKNTVKLTGPRGTLERNIPGSTSVKFENGGITVSIKGGDKQTVSDHGTVRSLLNNDVKGVGTGWIKQLELIGTGFRAEVAGKTLILTVGYSHTVKIEAPEGINFKVEKTIITVDGADHEAVGQVAANIRGVRPPEPYKGKGIKYVDEVIRRKPGKAAAAKATVV